MIGATHSARSTMRNKPIHRYNQRHSTGFSLVEVLISIVVLSFGMLAMVGLQASALQSNREARMQSTATSLARELAEKMRGNHIIGNLPTVADNPYLGNFASVPLAAASPNFCLSVGQNCPITAGAEVVNARTLASAEMTDWLARVDGSLPGARVRVCFDGTPFTAAGLPQWDCTDTGDIAVVKIGWTRGSTNRDPTATPFEKATAPSVVIPVTPASTL